MEVGLSPNPPPHKGGGAPPQFLAHVYCGRSGSWIQMPLGMEVGLGSENIVLDGDPAHPSPKGCGAPSQFLAHLYCGQTAAWIKMPLGTELGLSPDNIVLDGDPAPPPQKGHTSPIFGLYLLRPNGWIDQDATLYGGRPWPRRLCVGWGPHFPSPKGGRPPNFRPMSVVAKRLDGSRCHLVRR